MTQDYVHELLHRLGERVAAQPSVAPKVVRQLKARNVYRKQDRPASVWRNNATHLQWISASLATVGLIVGVVILFGDRTAFAFEQVQEALGKIKTVIASVEYPNQPQHNQRGYLSADHENARIEMGGLAVVMSPRGESLMMNMEEQTARRSPWNSEGADGRSPAEMIGRLIKIESEAVVCFGNERIDGRDLVRFQVQWDGHAPASSKKLRSYVWVDPKTRLPVRSETIARDPTDKATGNKHWIISYQFDVAIPDSHFSLKPPHGFRLVTSKDFRLPTSRLPKRPESLGLDKLVLVAKKGIGQIQFGDFQAQIERQLGSADEVAWIRSQTAEEKAAVAQQRIRARDEEWDKTTIMRERAKLFESFSDSPKDHWMLEYYGLGLRLSGSTNAGLTTIKCKSGKFGMYRPFPGRTAEGISIDSSPEDVRQAYGKPSIDYRSSVAGEDAIYMVFESRGITVEFRGGRVFEIILNRPTSE